MGQKSFRLFRHGAGQVWEERHHSQRLRFVTWSLSKAFEDFKESIVPLAKLKEEIFCGQSFIAFVYPPINIVLVVFFCKSLFCFSHIREQRLINNDENIALIKGES